MKSKTTAILNASSRAYEAIKEMIAQYQLIPGQKITYDQLAEKLKMSKTPIINALNRLEQEEFVISLPHRGFFIKEVDIEEVGELFAVREALEMFGVEECIKNQNPKMLKEVETAMMAHREYDFTTPIRNRFALGAAFHLKIAEMSGNRNLVRQLKHVFEHIYLRHRTEGFSPKRLAAGSKEHKEILDAIKEKNIGKAKKLMKMHIRVSKMDTIDGIQMTTRSFKF